MFIETEDSGSPGQPVTQVGVAALLMGGPVIDGVEAAVGPGFPHHLGLDVGDQGPWPGPRRPRAADRRPAGRPGVRKAFEPADRSRPDRRRARRRAAAGGADSRRGGAGPCDRRGGPSVARVADRATFSLRSTLSAGAIERRSRAARRASGWDADHRLQAQRGQGSAGPAVARRKRHGPAGQPAVDAGAARRRGLPPPRR